WTQESTSFVRTASLGLSPLSRRRHSLRDLDRRSRRPWNPGTRSCRRRRDPYSVWHLSACRPKIPCASGLRDKRGHLCAGSRRRSLPGDQKSSQQTNPCVLAVRRPCPSIVPWSRRKIALWLFLVRCISPQDHGRDSRSTLLSASFVAPFYLSCLPATNTRSCSHTSCSGSTFRSAPSTSRRCCKRVHLPSG